MTKSFVASSNGIVSTEARVKELRPFIERLITKAKAYYTSTSEVERANVIRYLRSRLYNCEITTKSMIAIAHRFIRNDGEKIRERNGGYLRIVKSSKVRKGDAAPVASLSLVESLV